LNSPKPPAGEYQLRQDQVLAEMRAESVDALVLGPGADLCYLTGISKDSTERLTALVLLVGGKKALITPKLDAEVNQEAAAAAGITDIRTWSDDEGPLAAISGLVSKPKVFMVNPDLTARGLLRLQRAICPEEVRTSETVVGRVRMVKSAWELEQLSRAAAAVTDVHAEVPGLICAGISEEALARQISELMIEKGHRLAAFVIVATGSNAAEPHHEPNETKVEPGELTVIDIGGPIDSGYFSDMTRMYCLGTPKTQALKAFEATKQAQQKACDELRTGMSTTKADAIAREYLKKASLDSFFIHRLGHGIGLEVHEAPTLGGQEEVGMKDGMVFSIEPGVYVPGQYGVRIEDIVTLNQGRVQRLHDFSHELSIIN
jgi:Xaa-Pro aminopeptidase